MCLFLSAVALTLFLWLVWLFGFAVGFRQSLMPLAVLDLLYCGTWCGLYLFFTTDTLVGGNWANSLNAGLWYWNVNESSSNAWTSVGARLLIKNIINIRDMVCRARVCTFSCRRCVDFRLRFWLLELVVVGVFGCCLGYDRCSTSYSWDLVC